MFRSPRQLRSGVKGKAIALSESDKRTLCRSLSDSASPSPKVTTMSPPAVDSAAIEKYVNKHLSSGDVFDNLVARLTEQLRMVIQDAVATATAPLLEEVKGLRKEVDSLTGRVSKLERELVDKTDDLEQYQRRNSLRIFGVEEKKGECTDDLVKVLCREQLGITLSDTALCRTHRVGRLLESTADGRPRHRPIIVKFVSYQDRRLVFSTKKRLKGSGITIREDLTAQRHAIFMRAAEKFGQRNVWTQDGRVLYANEGGVRGVATRLADLASASI